MVGLAYGLLAMVVFFGGILVAIVAVEDPRHMGALRITSDMRKPARWGYATIAILSFVIGMGDLPRNRRDADLLWVVPIIIVSDGVLWPWALSHRIAPGWWRSEEY